MIIKLNDQKSKFEVVRDIPDFRENNEFRYVRNCSLMGDKVTFISELGKGKDKIVIFHILQDQIKLIGEISGYSLLLI